LQQSLEAEHRERELVRQRNTIIYIGIAIIIVVAIYLVWRGIKRKNEDIARYVETIRELQENLDNAPCEIAA
jgi:type II secretory pathway component PulM